MRSLGKWLGIGLCGAIGLPALLAALLLLINARDATLNSRAQAVLTARHALVPPKDNAYFAIDGMTTLSAADSLSEHLLCGSAQHLEDCIERVAARPDEVAGMLAANQVLLAAYEGLADYRRFEDPVQLTATSKVLNWHPFLAGQRLFLSRVALTLNRGAADEAINALQRDMAFIRRLLSERDQLLIDKMVPAAGLRNDLLFIADLARTDRLSDAQFKRLADLVAPLTERERALRGVYAREFTGYASAIKAANQGDGLWNSLQMQFFKVNDTLNMKWLLVERQEAASAAPCTELAARQDELLKTAQLPLWQYVYNPFGKILYMVSVPNGDEYPMSLCDLQGMQSIVALQLALRSSHLGGTEAADYVRNAADPYRNPYTAQPFAWDAGEKSLSFAPVAARDRKYLPWPI